MQLTQVARKGEEGHIFVVKGRLRTLSSVCESRKFQCTRRNATETSTLGVLYTALMGLRQYISAWAIELLILVQGNARAHTRDRRSRAPTSFRIITTNRRIWGAIGTKSCDYETEYFR